jgi:AP-1 complex subunit beta-1
MNFNKKKNKSKNPTGKDSRFFTTNRKGENHELREELRSPVRDRKRDAVKKVIANMTVGKDVSTLFTDVVNCIQTDNLELKKLVYLYLINYAKTQPELAMLAVNTFVKDANDPNPLIRALAIRTMGCIRVNTITEYLCEPLSRCLRDEDPYVRKTAAVCVAKLYDISPELVEDRGFLDILRDLISDANPTVVANAIAALNEIADSSGKDVMQITAAILQKLLAALNECTEWGQVFILDSLAKYIPQDGREAEGIIERVSPRLQHANSAVVMSAVKVILKYMDSVTNTDTLRALTRKLAPPLVTLLNAEPELQYVALRNINLIVQKNSKILEHEIKVFFCKYNDPIYVKMEKLEIIIRLTTERNIDQVLLELKEYATEVDVDFVRRAVRAIGRCAIKLERAAERCINVLLDLIQTKVNYVVQEAVVVIKDIFRKYPNRYESIIATLCENLEELDEPEAKASMVWIIGEYAERIDNADELLESFLETFHDETSQVQLQLLTGTVKLFLKQPDTTQDMVQRVLTMATEESDNPDLRDRGYVYWRLLSSDPEAARAVVLSEKPEISDDTFSLDPQLLEELLGNLATLSSVYHKPPEAFVMKTFQQSTEDDDDEDEYMEEEEMPTDGTAESVNSYGGDLLDLDVGGTQESAPSGGGGGGLDLLGGFDSPPEPAAVTKPVLVTSEAGHGVFINGRMDKIDGQLCLDLEVGNTTPTPLQNFAVQFNKNTFGICPTNAQLVLPVAVSNGSTTPTRINLAVTPQMLNAAETNLNLQVAIKNTATGAVFYFTAPIGMEHLMGATPAMEIQNLITTWRSIDESLEASVVVNDLPTVDIEAVKAKLAPHNINFSAAKEVQPGQHVVYFSCKTVTNSSFLVELKFKAGMNVAKVSVRSPNKGLSELCKVMVGRLLSK